ncbi:MAG: proteasome subunit alpha [Nocardioidaceae bacterium]|nr:proteasome subunit alpha [Nocardioidaceae bacterium]
MSMPFYVSPEQLMKDRADFARKGIARGRSVVVVQYADGLLFVAENQSQALHKISELYDRLAFAAVGRYNEFENLRIAGVRLADMRGYSYDRRDVTGRGLANAYAQTLGTIFSSGAEKPYEVEIFVAEVGDAAPDDQVYRLTYDGSVADEHGYAVMGGSADQVSEYLRDHYTEGADLETALALAVEALGHDAAQPRTLAADRLEVAVLDRNRTQPRKFRRFRGAQLRALVDVALAKAAADASSSTASTDSAAGDAGEASTTTPADGKPPLTQAPSGSDKTASVESLTPAEEPSDPSDVLGDDLPPDADDARGG